MLEERMVIERRIVPGWLGVCQILREFDSYKIEKHRKAA